MTTETPPARTETALWVRVRPARDLKPGDLFLDDGHENEVVRASAVTPIPRADSPAWNNSVLVETNRGGRLFAPDATVRAVEFPDLPSYPPEDY